MENNLEIVEKNVKPSDLLAAKVMKMVVNGYNKFQISEALGTSVGNVNRIIYSPNGQTTLRKALADIHENIGYALPLVMDDAISELHKILLTENTAKTKLEAIKVAFGLTLNLTQIAGNEQVIT